MWKLSHMDHQNSKTIQIQVHIIKHNFQTYFGWFLAFWGDIWDTWCSFKISLTGLYFEQHLFRFKKGKIGDLLDFEFSIGCLWQATVRFRVNFFFIINAKRQIWLTAETNFISKHSAISLARTVISKHNFCDSGEEHFTILRFWQVEEINMNRR